MIQRTQHCMHPHTFLRTQIRNVLRKSYRNQNQSSTVLYFHFQTDRNCEVYLRTKLTRAPCRRRIGEVLLRAEKFGDLITADHKVLNEESESRNNHRYAVVVQDLATQWIQFIGAKQRLYRRRKRVYENSSNRCKKKTIVIYADRSSEPGKSCEALIMASSNLNTLLFRDEWFR